MDQRMFNAFRKIIYEKSGIALSEGKEALVHARVGKRMRSHGFHDHEAYLQYLIEDASGRELISLLDVISTNVTSFFREADHYVFAKQVISAWRDKGQRRFRIWSAASSTGEEPYSLAMTVQEALGNRDADVRILATDISTRVLDIAKRGVYKQESLKTVPKELRNSYFVKNHPCGESGNETQYTVCDALKRMVVFTRLNLSAPSFPMRGPLDLVFCCNVMIYFDNAVRRALLGEIYRLLKPGGYLVVGHAESLTGIISGFKVMHPSIYVK